MVFATRNNECVLHLFRSYENTEDDRFHPENPGKPDDCEIWEAARATSAAPRYLKPIVIGEQSYVDGAIGYNDPTPKLYDDIISHKRWDGTGPIPISIILTLGTGFKPTKTEQVRGWLSHLESLKKMFEVHIMRIGQSEREMESLAKQHHFSWYKWHGGVEVGAIRLDDCKNKTFGKMEEWIKTYMDSPNVKSQLETVALRLVEERRKRYLRTRTRWERFTLSTMFRCPMRSHTEIFQTRDKAERHVQTHHGDSVAIFNGIEVVQPCSRGPWCHEDL